MNSTEKRLKEAFDSITLPPGLRDSTLRMIEDKARTHRRLAVVKKRMKMALAACLMLVALGFGGFTAYAFETASVSIELNPSIELGINRFDTVVSARALNEDGQYVLDGVSLVGVSYREAIALMMGSERFRSFIDDDSFVGVSVACDDEVQASTLIAQSDDSLTALSCAGACSYATSQAYEEARHAGMGVARYEAASYLMELDPTITLGEARYMTMKELRDRIVELDPESDYAQMGQGHGWGHESSLGPGHGRHWGTEDRQ